MKLLNTNAKAVLILWRYVFWAIMATGFLYSCGSGGGSDSSGTGSVSFGLEMQAPDTNRALNFRQVNGSETPFECQTETYQIATIDAQIVDENNELLAEGGPFDCEDHQGTVSDVEAGDNRKAKVSAKNSSGIVIFAGESGSFTVTGGETTDAGTIILNRVEVAPVAKDDSATTDEDVPTTINVLDNDEDANGDTLTVSTVNQGSNGMVTTGGTSVTYTPNADFNGADSFTYTVSDGVNTDTATVNVIVNPINDRPKIIDQGTLTVREDDTLTISLADLTVEDPDSVYPDVFTLTVGDGANYTHTDNAVTPDFNFSGFLTVPVNVNDGFLESDPFNLTVRVTPVPDAPIINSVMGGVNQVVISWAPVDTDAESYTIYWLTSPEVPPVSKTNWTDRIRSIPATSTSYTHAGLENRTTYYYVVTAVNSFDESEVSSQISANTWYGEYLDGEVDDVGQYTSIALNDANMPVISYYDADNQILKVARISGVSVFREIADDGIGEVTNDVGQHTSIAVYSGEGGDVVEISYYDATDQGLKFAETCNPIECPGGYLNFTVYSASSAGQFSSIGLGSSGAPAISFYDAERGYLMWAEVAEKSINIIDSDGDVGQYTSIFSDNDVEGPQYHISYYDKTNGDLKYVAFDSPSEPLLLESIDTNGDVGKFTSLSVDSNGNAHISYYDATNGDLKYAQINPFTPSALTIMTLDGEGDLGQYSAIALDSNDNVHISYYDAVDGDLKYASNSSGTWTINTIDSVGDVGLFSSIAIESNDDGRSYPHISYYDLTNGRLKYATLSPIITVENVAPVANAGPSQSLAVPVLPLEIKLNGGGSSDDDNDPLTYNWTFTTNIPEGSTATLTNSTTAEPTFVADVNGTYEVQLIVNDGTVNSNPDFVRINVSVLVSILPDIGLVVGQ